MRGHEPVIAMRRRRQAPMAVRLHVGGDLPEALWRDWPTFTGTAQVHIPDSDNLERLDLRFVVGLLVWVDAHDEARMLAVEDAVKRAGACRVLSALLGPIDGMPEHPMNIETKAMRDTREGGFTWQQ